MRSLILLTIPGLFFAFSLQANTIGLRGGGSECVKRFIAYGQILSENISSIPADQKKLSDAINSAEIVAVNDEYIVIEGEQFYAVNEPEKMKISISSKWCSDSLNPKLTNTAIIVLHEYLGLSEPGFDKSYKISSHVYDFTKLNSEEMYYLVLTNGQDKSLVRTKIFTSPIDVKAHSLKVINPSFTNQSAELICDIENGNDLYLETVIGNNTFVSRYSILSHEYCINKIYEFVTKYDGFIGMTFLLGLESKTVYEINIH